MLLPTSVNGEAQDQEFRHTHEAGLVFVSCYCEHDQCWHSLLAVYKLQVRICTNCWHLMLVHACVCFC